MKSNRLIHCFVSNEITFKFSPSQSFKISLTTAIRRSTRKTPGARP